MHNFHEDASLRPPYSLFCTVFRPFIVRPYLFSFVISLFLITCSLVSRIFTFVCLFVFHCNCKSLVCFFILFIRKSKQKRSVLITLTVNKRSGIHYRPILVELHMNMVCHPTVRRCPVSHGTNARPWTYDTSVVDCLSYVKHLYFITWTTKKQRETVFSFWCVNLYEYRKVWLILHKRWTRENAGAPVRKRTINKFGRSVALPNETQNISALSDPSD